jgi:hypothetical protein
MDEMTNMYNILLAELPEKGPVQDLCVDGRIILKWILNP